MNRSDISILVVDDEPDSVDLLERTLGFDYQVHRATSGEEALELLPSIPNLALIITDQRMPGLTGTELLKRARRMRAEAVRIILTGYTDPADLIDAINSSNVYRYMTKPWDVDAMQSIVQRAVRLYQAGGGDLVDDATGLPNLGLLKNELAREMARADRLDRPFALVAIGIPGYLAYCDLAGCSAGETLMCAVADEVRKTTRKMDLLGVVGPGQLLLIVSECGEVIGVETRVRDGLAQLPALAAARGKVRELAVEIQAAVYPGKREVGCSPYDLLLSVGIDTKSA